MVPELIKKFITFYGTWGVSTMVISQVLDRILCQMNLVIPLPCYFCILHLMMMMMMIIIINLIGSGLSPGDSGYYAYT
jgi:hypothetical protein